MSPIPPQTVLDALQWRYATKKFDSTRTISADTWSALEQSLVLSPSSFGLQPWKFLVVTDPATRASLVPLSWGQTQPVDCSHFVVFTVRLGLSTEDVDRYIQRIVAVRGGTAEALSGYRDIMVGSLEKARGAGFLDAWQTHQVYIALGQFMACAALLGVDTCPMEGIEPARYDEALGLQGTGFATVVACAAGYRSADDKYAQVKKVRFEASEVIRHI
ncbi:MAG: NAD(P)H-dependent oxidoreductase [Verrucomicrobiae bacterium]|nr:NAD(P)H-dependent oxidoreductase [Verrucomicrobiae bacterium]